MSLYIHPENQELLWKIVNKNPLIQSYFSSYPSNIQESWFKQTISSFYEQNRANVATSEQLYEINKNTLSYMIQDVKRNVEFIEKNRGSSRFAEATLPSNLVGDKRSFSDQMQLRPNQPTPTDLLKPYSVTENKEDRFTDQYNQYQQNYQSMFDKKVPETIDFREQFNDQPLSGNMEDLVQRHLRERDEELKKYAPAPFFGNGLPQSVDPILRSDNLMDSRSSASPNVMQSFAPPGGFAKPSPSNYAVEPPFPTNFTSKLKIDSTPENIQLTVEELSPSSQSEGFEKPSGGSIPRSSLDNHRRGLSADDKWKNHSSTDSTVKWLDNENSDKIQSLEQEITMLKGQVLQLSDKISFLINTNKDIFDFSAQRLKMTNIKISGGFLFDPQDLNLL